MMDKLIITDIGSHSEWNEVVRVARTLGYSMLSEKGTDYEKLYVAEREIRLGDSVLDFGNGKTSWYEQSKYDDYETIEASDFISSYGVEPDNCGSSSPCGEGTPTPVSNVARKVNLFARRLLSSSYRRWIRAGFLTTDLQLTREGVDVLHAHQLSTPEFQAALDEAAASVKSDEDEDAE